jgi:hypothetical protein
VPVGKPLRVGIALMSLVPVEMHQPDLFEKPRDAMLVKAIDAVNENFGKGSLVYGDVYTRARQQDRLLVRTQG